MLKFKSKIAISMQVIGTQAGFVRHKSYEQSVDKDHLNYLTIVTSKSQEALEKAKASVQTEYDRLLFDSNAMMKSLHITLDRGIYTKVEG